MHFRRSGVPSASDEKQPNQDLQVNSAKSLISDGKSTSAMDKTGSQWRILVIGLLAIHTVLLSWSCTVHSPTLNEPSHLVAGIANWQFHRSDIYKVNPPLTRLLAAAPVMLVGYETDWRTFSEGPGVRPEVTLGEAFVAANGARSFWLFTLARWACVPFSILGGYICFRWARELYGPIAGILALTLWCFCPNILAHGQLITCDNAATALGLTACYAFWHWLKRPRWWETVVAGLMLGFAQLAKMTLVVFFPLWFLLWAAYHWPDRHSLRWRNWLRQLGMLCVQTGLAIYVLDFGYGFDGTFARLGDYQFVSSAFAGPSGTEKPRSEAGNRFSNSLLAGVRIPLPKNYVLGIDEQKLDFEGNDHPSYLRGELRYTGWWYYYLYALTIKVPLGTWLLAGLAAGATLWTDLKVQRRDELVLLAPAIVILMFVSSQYGISQHLRYVLPAFPFVFIWIGRVAAVFGTQRRILSVMAILALCWAVMSSMSVYPHSLSYFNELAGGPTRGPAHLIHSNIDWGQDLLFLKNWIDDHPAAAPLKLAYFGGLDPVVAGINYRAPVEVSDQETESVTIPPGWYAISVNFVRGFPNFMHVGDGTTILLKENALAVFQSVDPVAKAGYSIYIYHLSEPISVRKKPAGLMSPR